MLIMVALFARSLSFFIFRLLALLFLMTAKNESKKHTLKQKRWKKNRYIRHDLNIIIHKCDVEMYFSYIFPFRLCFSIVEWFFFCSTGWNETWWNCYAKKLPILNAFSFLVSFRDNSSILAIGYKIPSQI